MTRRNYVVMLGIFFIVKQPIRKDAQGTWTFHTNRMKMKMMMMIIILQYPSNRVSNVCISLLS